MSTLIEIATRDVFDGLTKSAYEKAIVFIKDSQQIWTHGTFYGGRTINKTGITITPSTTAWTDLLSLNNVTGGLNLSNGTYTIQMKVKNGTSDVQCYSGIFSYCNGQGNDEITLHKSGTGDQRLFLQTNATKLQIASSSASSVTLDITVKEV